MLPGFGKKLSQAFFVCVSDRMSEGVKRELDKEGVGWGG